MFNGNFCCRMKVDYSELSASYKTLKNHEVKKHREKLAKAIRDASVNLQKVQAPNMKVRIIFTVYKVVRLFL